MTVARSTQEPVALVHLVRSGNGPEPLRRFLDSYRAHPAGCEHRLVLLFKGFDDGEAELAAQRALARDLSIEEVRVSDEGLDLKAYRTAAGRLCAPRYCFVNSHSVIRADGWLGHLDRALQAPEVGMSGASGSWASMLSYALFQAGLPSAYRSVYEDRAGALSAFAAIDRERKGGAEPIGGIRGRVHTSIALAGMAVGFERFPAHHLRTNAFTIEHDLFMAVSRGPLRRKVQSHRLESGRDSITRRVEGQRLAAVVVDRGGRSHTHEDWPSSETFWQGRQRGLLIADNQTESYERGDADRRLLLARYAWGPAARREP